MSQDLVTGSMQLPPSGGGGASALVVTAPPSATAPSVQAVVASKPVNGIIPTQLQLQLGRTIAELRQRQKLTVRELAEKIGCSDTMIRSIEAGRCTDMTRKVMNYLGMSMIGLEQAFVTHDRKIHKPYKQRKQVTTMGRGGVEYNRQQVAIRDALRGWLQHLGITSVQAMGYCGPYVFKVLAGTRVSQFAMLKIGYVFSFDLSPYREYILTLSPAGNGDSAGAALVRRAIVAGWPIIPWTERVENLTQVAIRHGLGSQPPSSGGVVAAPSAQAAVQAASSMQASAAGGAVSGRYTQAEVMEMLPVVFAEKKDGFKLTVAKDAQYSDLFRVSIV